MKLVKLIMWLAVFSVITFLWIVVFEYGFKDFTKGVKMELEALHDLVVGV